MLIARLNISIKTNTQTQITSPLSLIIGQLIIYIMILRVTTQNWL